MDVHEYIEQHQGRLVRDLQAMVCLPTVNPPGIDYRKMVDWLARRCAGLGLEVAVHQVPQEALRRAGLELPRYNAVARWPVRAAPAVHFNAHYDVVPAAGKWRCGSPFAPEVRGGWLYGRGSGDMKGSIAALLMGLEALRRTGREPAFGVECSFTADEETGGELGAGYLVRQGLVKADYAVVCEGASGNRVGLGHNGVLWLEVEIEGKAAHASSPEQGHNAFETMAELVWRLRAWKKGLQAPARRWRDPNGQERWPTLNIGGVFGGGTGDKVNTVPARAAFSIDRRVLPSETVTRAEEELRGALEKAAAPLRGVRVRVHTRLRLDPCVGEGTGTLPQAFARAVQRVRRQASAFSATRGFTDLHYFVAEGGLPGIGYGVKGEQAHGVDERVGVRELVQTARVYAEFMQRGL
ncbi:MAG: M20/M25/M40 family metallo-hydrolase [Candidatus Latescibacteria bacterium]|nr:M20/M25/M40 family metallo-hydrolase [Candidatus Latescibacterota bacterium]